MGRLIICHDPPRPPISYAPEFNPFGCSMKSFPSQREITRCDTLVPFTWCSLRPPPSMSQPPLFRISVLTIFYTDSNTFIFGTDTGNTRIVQLWIRVGF
jgi:hypothetical protein